LKIFKHIGCELGNIEKFVATEGLKGTLQELFRQGIYLIPQDFRGEKELGQF